MWERESFLYHFFILWSSCYGYTGSKEGRNYGISFHWNELSLTKQSSSQRRWSGFGTGVRNTDDRGCVIYAPSVDWDHESIVSMSNKCWTDTKTSHATTWRAQVGLLWLSEISRQRSMERSDPPPSWHSRHVIFLSISGAKFLSLMRNTNATWCQRLLSLLWKRINDTNPYVLSLNCWFPRELAENLLPRTTQCLSLFSTKAQSSYEHRFIRRGITLAGYMGG